MKLVLVLNLFVFAIFINGEDKIVDFPFQDKCTAIAVGKKATKDGSTMTTHTADCAECDWRINKVPARDWPAGSLRPIYLLTGAYPRQVRDDRGITWSPENLEDIPKFRSKWEKMRGDIIGYIPQVQHTYALIEGLYGIMNEFQVAIGESTCASKLWAPPIGDNGKGKALLEVSELSQIALERCRTAREAIQTMGDLAVKYGFYSGDWDISTYGPTRAMGEGGEALTVIDPQEAWMFHIIPDDTGTSAVWVAQRVPDDHVTVVANTFTIREVDPLSPNFMYSENLWLVASRQGFWDGSSPLDFKLAYTPERYRPNYSNRRVWRVFDMFAPSLHLPSETDPMANDYPFSVPVDSSKRIGVEDLMRAQRDHFEGTPYSTADGLAAGPFGDPNRFDVWKNGNMTIWDAIEGEFPRTISLFRTSYSIVAHARQNVPNVLSLVWLCQYAPDSSTYMPLYIAATSLPRPLIRGTMHLYDTSSAWWNFCVVGNYAARFYNYAMKPVRELQSKLEKGMISDAKDLETKIMLLLATTDNLSENWASIANSAIILGCVETLTEFTVTKGQKVSDAWKELFPYLLSHFRDGFILNTDDVTIGITRMFYPKWWLDAVGYFNIKPNPNPEAILFGARDRIIATSGSNDNYVSKQFFYVSLIGTSVLSAISVYSFLKYYVYKYENQGYSRIINI